MPIIKYTFLYWEPIFSLKNNRKLFVRNCLKKIGTYCLKYLVDYNKLMNYPKSVDHMPFFSPQKLGNDIHHRICIRMYALESISYKILNIKSCTHSSNSCWLDFSTRCWQKSITQVWGHHLYLSCWSMEVLCFWI